MTKTKDVVLRTYTVNLTPREDQKDKEVRLTVPKKVIPIMFVPGVMGSCLKSRDIFTGKKSRVIATDVNILKHAPIETTEAWGLNNIGAWGGVKKSAVSSSKRAEMLNPELTSVMWEVSNTGKEDTEETKSYKIKQGWGTVLKNSYWDFFDSVKTFFCSNSFAAYLKEKSQEDSVYNSLLDDILNKFLQLTKLYHADALLTKLELQKLLKNIQNYEFRVYACGYNWLRDNDESANGYHPLSAEFIEANELSNKTYGQSDLKSRIVQAKQETGAEKVIIITHSMGGLVARAYCADAANAQNVYGVFHSVMPATGAPAFYKKARAGFSSEARWWNAIGRITNAVIGNSAMTMDPVLLKAPGPLQLMPWTNYVCMPNINKERKNFWLGVKDKNNKVLFTRDTTELLNNNQAWYGLLPDSTHLELVTHVSSIHAGTVIITESISPLEQTEIDGVTYEPRINPNGLVYLDKDGKQINDQTFFEKILQQVTDFWQKYDNQYFIKTIIAYVGNVKSWDAIYWRIKRISKNKQSSTLIETDKYIQTMFENAKLVQDDGVGNITIEYGPYRIALSLEGQQDLGDGTVSFSSGIAPKSHVRDIFVLSDYRHDSVYTKTALHNHHVAFYAILQFSKEIKEC